MEKIVIEHFKTSYGEIVLGSFKEHLVLCDWQYRKMRTSIDERIQKEFNSTFAAGSSDVIQKTKIQLEEYFTGERKEFSIPLLFAGTDFQKSVWTELLKIPFGKTESYLNLSKKLNNAKAIRAVASANGANSIAIIVPCHRVVGIDGELTGYAGGLNTKRKLLVLEGKYSDKEQLILFQ